MASGRGSGMRPTYRVVVKPKQKTRGPCPYELAGIPCDGHEEPPLIGFAETMRARMVLPADHPVMCVSVINDAQRTEIE